jgi:sialic acid synthase SpsE
MNRTFIIAEAGVNHNGSLDMAIEMINVAAAARADAVKFQTFKAEKVIAVNAPKAGYQTETTGSEESQLEMVKRLELDEAAHKTLLNHYHRASLEPHELSAMITSIRRIEIAMGSGTGISPMR